MFNYSIWSAITKIMNTTKKICWYIGLTTNGGAILKEVETIFTITGHLLILKLEGVNNETILYCAYFWQ